MQLKIITHERIVFEGEVDEIIIQAQTGQIGILKDHIPFTTVLEVGVTKVKQGDKIATSGTSNYLSDIKSGLHFEIIKEGKNINPEKTYSQSIKEL